MTLVDIVQSKNLQTDKGNPHSYLERYDRLFPKAFALNELSSNKLSNLSIIEIGVFKGESIQLWNEYFTQSVIIGMDLPSSPHFTLYTKEEVTRNKAYVITGNAYSTITKNKVYDVLSDNKHRSIDIFIDDGDHNIQSQVRAIQLYLPLLSTPGVFIIEDIQGDEYLEELINEAELVTDLSPCIIFEVMDNKSSICPDDLALIITRE